MTSAAHRLVPTSFDPEDPELRGHPIPLDWKWTSCEDALRNAGAVGVMMRLPLFWQLEVPLYDACKRTGAFVFTGDRGNMPLCAEALRLAEIDCVVTDAADAIAFSAFLREKHRPQPRAWFIIHPGNEPLRALEELGDAAGAQEIHRMPGVPLLEQCATLQSLQRAEFHLVEGVDESQFPNAHARDDRTCACGRVVMTVR